MIVGECVFDLFCGKDSNEPEPAPRLLREYIFVKTDSQRINIQDANMSASTSPRTISCYLPQFCFGYKYIWISLRIAKFSGEAAAGGGNLENVNIAEAAAHSFPSKGIAYTYTPELFGSLKIHKR